MEYEFPPHVRVSRDCRDLLKQILVPEPAKRFTVEDIQQHPWYLKDLPPGVKEMNDNLPPPAPGLQARPPLPTTGRVFSTIPYLQHQLLFASCRVAFLTRLVRCRRPWRRSQRS